jgi:WD40 repeat protein
MSTILVLALCAVLAGARSFTAIGEWVANASPHVLDTLGVGGCAPCESTLRRSLRHLDGDELDATVGNWAARCTTQPGLWRALALDGKTQRGAIGADGIARHLMAAIGHHAGAVLRQVNVERKTTDWDPFTGRTNWVGAVATVVLPDGRPVAVTGGEDATVRIWDLQRKTGVQEPLHLVGPVSALAALHLPTGVHLAITGAGITAIELRHQAL